MFATAELVDGWSVNSSQFTWTGNRNGRQSFSTLDRIYFSKDLFTINSQIADWSLSLSDHAMVLATFSESKNETKHHCAVPRLDPRILEDLETRLMMEQEFERMNQEASKEWNPNPLRETGCPWSG